MKLKINHIAVWILVVLYQVIPAAWYGSLFAEKWMSLSGITMKDVEANPSPAPYIVAIVASILMNYTYAWLFTKLNIDSAVKGMQTAALFWLAFLFSNTITHDMFSLRPLELTLINEGETFITALLSGFLLGAWRKYEN